MRYFSLILTMLSVFSSLSCSAMEQQAFPAQKPFKESWFWYLFPRPVVNEIVIANVGAQEVHNSQVVHFVTTALGSETMPQSFNSGDLSLLESHMNKEMSLESYGLRIKNSRNNVVSQTALLFDPQDKDFDTFHTLVRKSYKELDKQAPTDIFWHYIWPLSWVGMPVSLLLGVCFQIRHKQDTIPTHSLIATGMGIGSLAVCLGGCFRESYYQKWANQDKTVAGVHLFAKNLLHGLDALKKGRIKVEYTGDKATITEYAL